MDRQGNFKQVGENITNPKLAKTLETIRDEPMSFYNGSLAQTIAEDMKRAGGIITLDDLKNYEVEVSKPIENRMGSMRWFTVPPPRKWTCHYTYTQHNERYECMNFFNVNLSAHSHFSLRCINGEKRRLDPTVVGRGPVDLSTIRTVSLQVKARAISL